MPRDALKDPRFGDVFEWGTSGYRVLYLRAYDNDLWIGTCVTDTAEWGGQVGETYARAPLQSSTGGFSWRLVEKAEVAILQERFSQMDTDQLHSWFEAAVTKGSIR